MASTFLVEFGSFLHDDKGKMKSFSLESRRNLKKKARLRHFSHQKLVAISYFCNFATVFISKQRKI